MKQLIIFLLLCLFTMGTYAQVKEKTIHLKGQNVECTPGNLLQKSSNHIISGIFVSIAGTSIISYAIKKDNFKPTLYFGSGLSILGVFLEFKGIWLIGQAGKQMEKERISYSVFPHGVSLSINF